MEEAEDGEDEEQQRSDTGEADAVEEAWAHAGEAAEAPEAGEGDEEAGDGEKDRDAVAAVAEEEVREAFGKGRADVHAVEVEAQPGVEEDDGQDGEATQEVYGFKARGGRGDFAGRGVSHVEHSNTRRGPSRVEGSWCGVRVRGKSMAMRGEFG